MLKRNLKTKICRLCLNTKCDIDLKVIEVIKEVLEIVLPRLSLEEGDGRLICNSCSVKLFAAFNFKSVCTDTEDTIFPYVNSPEASLIDLREIYLKEKRDIQLIDILEYQKICRLCFQLVRCGFVSLNEVDADIINNYIPEVNFNATKDPVICKVCSDSLITHGTFLSSCLAAQEQKRKVRGDPVDDRECCIKTEDIKIEDDCDSDPPTSLENVETIKNSDGRVSSENEPVEYKNHLLRKVRTYTCNTCDFKTVHKGSLKKHCLKHTSLTPTYVSKRRDASSPCPLSDQARRFQCENCPYKTYVKQFFLNHCWTHKLPSKTKVYQCEKCHYRVIRENDFRRHHLRHEDSAVRNEKHPPRKLPTYTCNRCDFKTMYKNSLKVHCLKHKVSLTPTYISPKSQCKSGSRDASSPCTLKRHERMYQCEKCPYRTHLRDIFVRHWSTHELPSEVKVYQCDKCHYRVTQKNHFRSHQLRHRDGEIVEKYTCDKCDFQTRYKTNLLNHQLRHKTKKCKDVKCRTGDDGELTYKCNVCKYETKDENQLLVHRCHHGSPTKEPKFKCQMCAFESTNKGSWTRHQLTHNSEAKTYKCDACFFQTIWRYNFIRHQLSKGH